MSSSDSGRIRKRMPQKNCRNQKRRRNGNPPSPAGAHIQGNQNQKHLHLRLSLQMFLMLRKQSRSYNPPSPSLEKEGCYRPNSDDAAGRLWKFQILVPILAFLILSPLSKISFAQKDLGVPVREGICWSAFVGPGK